MGWYDFFSRFYDSSLEPLYREQRIAAAEALALEPSSVVLDLPCGTGQSFDAIVPRLGGGGALLGADSSAGMLAKARARAEKNGWANVSFLQTDVHALDRGAIAGALGDDRPIDRLHVFLGMTAFPRHEEAFARLWELLAPGGVCVIVDVHAETLGMQGRNGEPRRAGRHPAPLVGADGEGRAGLHAHRAAFEAGPRRPDLARDREQVVTGSGHTVGYAW